MRVDHTPIPEMAGVGFRARLLQATGSTLQSEVLVAVAVLRVVQRVGKLCLASVLQWWNPMNEILNLKIFKSYI